MAVEANHCDGKHERRKQQEVAKSADEAKAENLRELACTTFKVGEALAQEGKVLEALACFKDCVALDPMHVEGTYSLACMYQDLNHPEALDTFQKAIRLQPSNFPSWHALGYLYNIPRLHQRLRLPRRSAHPQNQLIHLLAA